MTKFDTYAYCWLIALVGNSVKVGHLDFSDNPALFASSFQKPNLTATFVMLVMGVGGATDQTIINEDMI